MSLVPLGGLLVGMSDPQEAALAEGAAKELKSHREIDAVAVGESAREAQTADAGQIGGDREDIRQVHLEGVVGLLTQAEGCLRRGGGEDGVHLGEGLVEVAADQGTDFMGLPSWDGGNSK